MSRVLASTLISTRLFELVSLPTGSQKTRIDFSTAAVKQTIQMISSSFRHSWLSGGPLLLEEDE